MTDIRCSLRWSVARVLVGERSSPRAALAASPSHEFRRRDAEATRTSALRSAPSMNLPFAGGDPGGLRCLLWNAFRSGEPPLATLDANFADDMSPPVGPTWAATLDGGFLECWPPVGSSKGWSDMTRDSSGTACASEARAVTASSFRGLGDAWEVPRFPLARRSCVASGNNSSLLPRALARKGVAFAGLKVPPSALGRRRFDALGLEAALGLFEWLCLLSGKGPMAKGDAATNRPASALGRRWRFVVAGASSEFVACGLPAARSFSSPLFAVILRSSGSPTLGWRRLWLVAEGLRPPSTLGRRRCAAPGSLSCKCACERTLSRASIGSSRGGGGGGGSGSRAWRLMAAPRGTLSSRFGVVFSPKGVANCDGFATSGARVFFCKSPEAGPFAS